MDPTTFSTVPNPSIGLGSSIEQPLSDGRTSPPGMVMINAAALIAGSSKTHFQRYVEHTAPYSAVNLQRASALVEEGKKFLTLLRGGLLQAPTGEQRRNYIVPLTWYLMSRACEQGEWFVDGMFVFEDPGHTVTNFFSSVASRRLSSHYHGRVMGSNFGIDQPTGLPSGCRTVLFGALNVLNAGGEWMFLKPEDHGTESCFELSLHAVDYCLHLSRTCLGIKKPAYSRVETPPKRFHRHAKALAQAGFPLSSALERTWGLSYLFQTALPYMNAPDSVSSLSPCQRATLRDFLQDASSSYEWLSVRNGHEVVLSERVDPYKEKLATLLSSLDDAASDSDA
jgi:hypothetical protein